MASAQGDRVLLLLLYTACTAGLTAATPPWSRSCSSTDTAADVLTGIDLTGKLIIYTGGDGQLAGVSTLELAKKNASLVLACRKVAKCEAVRQSIVNKTGTSASIEAETLDLSSIESIHTFADRIMKRHGRVDVLVNSAGVKMTSMTVDKMVATMQVNLLGPALLSHLLLPALRGHGRVVNVAAAAYGTKLPDNTTAADLAALCTSVDPELNRTGRYFDFSKFLMVHHALELARREPTVAAVALAPGVAFQLPPVPTWLKYALMHFDYPDWLLQQLPPGFQRYVKACTTNLKGLQSCPENQEEGAAIIVAAAAWPEVDSHSGVYLDFDTKKLPEGAPNVYGQWTQSDPTCVPREPDGMDLRLRSEWYDEMLKLMGRSGSDRLVI